MDWQIVGSIAASVSALGLCISVLVAISRMREDAKNSIALKKLDVIMHCTNRYADIIKSRDEISMELASLKYMPDIDDPKMNENRHRLLLERQELFYRRYWGLKGDQFDFWLNGYIDADTINDWVNHAHMAISANNNKEGPYKNWDITITDGWSRFKNSGAGVSNKLFVTFYSELFDIANNPSIFKKTEEIMHALKRTEMMYAQKSRDDFRNGITVTEYFHTSK